MKYIIQNLQDKKYYSCYEDPPEIISDESFHEFIGESFVFDSYDDALAITKKIKYNDWISILPIHG